MSRFRVLFYFFFFSLFVTPMFLLDRLNIIGYNHWMNREQAINRANEIIKELRVILPTLGNNGHDAPSESVNRKVSPQAITTVTLYTPDLLPGSDYEDDAWRNIKAELDGSANTTPNRRRKLGGNSDGYINGALNRTIVDQFNDTQKRTLKRLGRSSVSNLSTT